VLAGAVGNYFRKEMAIAAWAAAKGSYRRPGFAPLSWGAVECLALKRRSPRDR